MFLGLFFLVLAFAESMLARRTAVLLTQQKNTSISPERSPVWTSGSPLGKMLVKTDDVQANTNKKLLEMFQECCIINQGKLFICFMGKDTALLKP